MINSFKGDYFFLSNFFPAPVKYNGITYASSEAAFQAQKTLDIKERLEFSDLNPSEAKRKGRHVRLRDDWEEVKEDIMFDICYAKFSQNKDLGDKLDKTGCEFLEEGNNWGDTFWGTVNGKGENRLGGILMKVRSELNCFDVNAVTIKCVEWIRDFFEKNGKGCNAVIGISGGKDSSIAAALCVQALGKERVIGVLMPNGLQKDISDAYDLVNHLEIKHFVINIKDSVDGVLNEMSCHTDMSISEQTKINLPARIRMSVLYAVSQSNNGRVVNTCNLSEDWVGYSTRYGDAAGDFSPLGGLTVTEIKKIGKFLGLPSHLVDKTPSDGLCGKSDEENLGFTYEELDKYIKLGKIDDPDKKVLIDSMHEKNLFKLQLMPTFKLD